MRKYKFISPFQRRYSMKIFSVYDISSLFCFVFHPGWFLNKNMSSPAGLNKTFSFFLQKYHLWPFSGTEVQHQSHFFQRRPILWCNLEESFWEHCGKRWVVCFYRHVSSACRYFPKFVILASCIPVVRPFLACYASFFIGHLICFTCPKIRFFFQLLFGD